jgi:hypothetical protein
MKEMFLAKILVKSFPERAFLFGGVAWMCESVGYVSAFLSWISFQCHSSVQIGCASFSREGLSRRKETFSVAVLFSFAKTIVDFSNKQKLGEKYMMIHRNLLNVNGRSVFMGSL